MNPLATPENVAALDRAAEWISSPRRWIVGSSNGPQGRHCARGSVMRQIDPQSFIQMMRWDEVLNEVGKRLYSCPMTAVNDYRGRIPAKHVIEALAAELRSQLP